MNPPSTVAAIQKRMIKFVIGSVITALIAWFFELKLFFAVVSWMSVLPSILPLVQWILCDEPPLERRDKLLRCMIPCMSFMLAYALPGIVVSVTYRSAVLVVYAWDTIIWHISTFWLFHIIFLWNLHFCPGFARGLSRICVQISSIVLFCTATGITKFRAIASNQYERVVSAQERIVEARKPKGIFTYKEINDRQNKEPVTATAATEPKIRLLKLYRRNPISEITCRLEEFLLPKVPTYEAISYRWDNAQEQRDIIINGLRHSLPRRAYDVLKGRSSLFRSRWIWIDAICIDQGSDEDKTRQVRLMGDIYRNASRTIIWLGSERLSRYERSSTLNLLHIISMARAGVMISFDRLRRDFMEKSRPGIGPGRWRGLNNLLRHEWFGRVWMVQEVVVAKKVHAVYGGAYLDWNQFSDAIEALNTTEMSSIVWSAGETSTIGQTGAPLAIIYTATLAALRQRYSRKEALTLKDGLLACSRFEASLAVDKIYSLQGFISEEIDERLKVDYMKESREQHSVEELYINTAKYLLDKDYVLDILSLAGVGHARKLNKLPSWVVDWSYVPELLHFTGGRNTCIYRTSSNSTSCINLTSIHGRITLRGFKVDVITKLGPKLLHDAKFEEKPSEHVDSIRRIFKFYREAEALSKSSTIGRTQKDSFWRTIIGDRLWVAGMRAQDPAPDHCAAWNRSLQILSQVAETPAFDLVLQSGDPWAQISVAERILSNLQTTHALMSLGLKEGDFIRNLTDAYKFVPSMGAACTNRMFCITKGGSMAVVPPLTEENDVVFLPLGAQAPFVIRSHGMEVNRRTHKTRLVYKLVGECYVHGMMEGEMMCNHPELDEDLILE